MSYIYPIILSGGVGSRLWPLSRSRFPKQLLNLAGERSLIQETALRTVGPGFAKPLIICHAEHRFPVAEQIRAIGVEPENIILEPSGRNTAPAAAVAALTVGQKDPEAVLLLMPADHAIQDLASLQGAVRVAQDLAKNGFLVTFGVHPRRADSGYGYIQRGAALLDQGRAFAASRFVEKPDTETADRYVAAGDYYWNSGMFAFKAETFLAELEGLEPDILTHCRQAISDGKQDAGYFFLAPDSFAACKSISIDYAVMERTDKATIVPVDMGWSDIGSWTALWEITDQDAGGNVVKGDVLHDKVRGNYLRSEGPLIAALGVSDLVVVATPDAVLVSTKSATQNIKQIVERLDRAKSDLHVVHRRVLYSWGSADRIDEGENFEVRRITINPRAGLALGVQSQHVRRWVVVSGAARIIRDRGIFLVKEGDIYTPSSADHRLENVGDAPLLLIETRALSGAGCGMW